MVDPNDRDRVDAERGSAATHAELRHDALHGERGREVRLSAAGVCKQEGFIKHY